MEITKTRLDNIKVQYISMLKVVKSFPDFSNQKRQAKKELSDYLESVKERFGQETVDLVAGKIEKKVREVSTCSICGSNVYSHRMKKHIKKNHS